MLLDIVNLHRTETCMYLIINVIIIFNKFYKTRTIPKNNKTQNTDMVLLIQCNLCFFFRRSSLYIQVIDRYNLPFRMSPFLSTTTTPNPWIITQKLYPLLQIRKYLTQFSNSYVIFIFCILFYHRTPVE